MGQGDLMNEYLNVDYSATELVKLYEREMMDRGTLDALYQECSDFTFPRVNNITKIRHTEQKIDNEEIYDDTAINANVTFANGLQTYNTPPNVKWFSFRARSPLLADDEDVKEWAADATDAVFKTLGSSNFSEKSHENYMLLGGFGTSGLFVDEDPKDDVRFYELSIPHGVCIFEDAKGRVNMMIRRVSFTTMQAIEEFGDSVGENVLEAYKAKDYSKPFHFLHCVGERHLRDVSKMDSVNMPFFSKWVNLEKKKIVKESGYPEQPFFVGRLFKNSSSKYGFSPNMMVLPSIRSLNRARRQVLKAADMALTPPLDVPYKGYSGRINLNPGVINYRRDGMQDGQGIKPIVTVDPRGYAFSGENIQDLRESIKQAYFVNMFLALEQKSGMTATEVAERVNEKMSQLGPALKRIENEQYQGALHRVLMILIRKGKVKPPPEGLEYDIVYTSRLEFAQRLSEANSTSQYVASMASAAQLNPEILDNIHFDNLAKYYEGVYNAPPDLTRRPEDVKKIRDQRAEQAQQQAMLQAMQVSGKAGRDLAEAEKAAQEGVRLGTAA